jgi:hypothetical protein
MDTPGSKIAPRFEKSFSSLALACDYVSCSAKCLSQEKNLWSESNENKKNDALDLMFHCSP